VPLEGLGIIIFFSIGAGFIISSIFINTILTKLGFEKPLRSALWFSALVGPYISIVAINNWDNPALSHITGVVTAILAFVLSYFLDRAFTRKSKSGVDDH
jgi:FtsH-binding integral membrane protein